MENKLKTDDVIKMVNDHSEKVERNKKAKAYSAKCEKKRKNKIYDVAVIVLLLLFSVCTYFVCKVGHDKNVQAQTTIVTETETSITTEITTEMVVSSATNKTPDREEWCMVVEVVDDLVVVDLQGNLYEFYAEGFKVGQELFCKFIYNVDEHEWCVDNVIKIKPNTTEPAVLVGIDTETGDYKIQLANGDIITISDPPEVWYIVEFNAKGDMVGIHEWE